MSSHPLGNFDLGTLLCCTIHLRHFLFLRVLCRPRFLARLLLLWRRKEHGQRQTFLGRRTEFVNRFVRTGKFRREVGQGPLVYSNVGFHFGSEELHQGILDLLSLVLGQSVFAGLRQENISKRCRSVENVDGTAGVALDKVSVDSQNVDIVGYDLLEGGLDDRQRWCIRGQGGDCTTSKQGKGVADGYCETYP